MSPSSLIKIPYGLTNMSFPILENNYCIFTHNSIYDSIIYHPSPLFLFTLPTKSTSPPFRQSQKSLSPQLRPSIDQLQGGVGPRGVGDLDHTTRLSCVRFEPLSLFGCFRKYWYPQIINLNRVFHYKPSILGYPYFWKHPFSLYVHINSLIIYFALPSFCESSSMHLMGCWFLKTYFDESRCGSIFVKLMIYFDLFLFLYIAPTNV